MTFFYKINVGAKEAGLKESYISKLEKIETHKAPDWVLELRKKHIPKIQDLPEVTLAELAKHTETGDVWISVLGYVVK